jgi:molybdenum cofactor guanylyltransferase
VSERAANAAITGVVLAGGMGRRMASVDKGLVVFRSKPMVAHVIERLAPQVSSLIINANRSVDAYASFGYPVLSDAISGFAGPLAGLHAAMRVCTTQWLVSAPCDSPFLPLDLVARLFEAVQRDSAEIAVADSDNVAQPVFAMYNAALLPSLEAFLNSGERKIDRWTAKHRVANVAFTDAHAFANINTIEELEKLT